MYKSEIISRLESLIRKSKDAIKINIMMGEVFKEEYNNIIFSSTSTQKDYSRAFEIYPWVIDCPKQAKEMTREAELFINCLDLIKKHVPDDIITTS